MSSTEEMIGRSEVDDIEAILAVTNSDVDAVEHVVADNADAIFTWDYSLARPGLRKLYEKAKTGQWHATTDLPWDTEGDLEAVIKADEAAIGTGMDPTMYIGTPVEKWGEKEWVEFGMEGRRWSLSQFMHGEQGALIATAKIVQTVPTYESKFYAATQVMDEARHVEAYSRLLHEKFKLAYPITPTLAKLLEATITDRRWDMTYLGMQILIEGLALAASRRARDNSTNPLCAAGNAYVMQDGARHVAFGRLALRDYYPQLSDAERDEREEFVVEACYHMRDRFDQKEVWENLGLPVKECVAAVDQSDTMKQFRRRLFTRIVPTVKDIGLWGTRVRRAYEDMGVMEFADTDAAAILENDNRVAEEFDAKQFVAQQLGQTS